MKLTKHYLKQLQRQLNKEYGSVPKLSESRIDLLLIHDDEIPIINDPCESSQGESDQSKQTQNSSVVNFEVGEEDDDGNCVKFETLLDINQTVLNNVEVHVKDDSGLSQIFDPNNSSLLYVNKKRNDNDGLVINHTTNTNVLEELDSNLKPPPTAKQKNKTKIPILAAAKNKRTSSKYQHQLQLRSRTVSSNYATKSTGPKSQIDLRFPKLDQLIQKLAEQRSL